jgi:hypothetical protein
MNSASWEQAKGVITEALKRPAQERESFVRQQCADSTLAGEIITLLAAYRDDSDFLAEPAAAADEPDDIEPGTRVGPYVIVDSIGRGGMGQVFLGSDPRLRRKVALKCVVKSLAGSGERRLRILHEARAAARVTHPNVATIHDVIEHENRAFIVMEYVEGENLAARLKRERMPFERVVSIGSQLASALAAAHAKNVVHRDLKPGNVHLTAEGTVKVLDFGIANVPRMATTLPTGEQTMAAAPPLPRRPQAGTPPYMSPEQLTGRAVDERSDIYSLGVVLFEMTTGRRPYRETEHAELVKAFENDAPRADAIDRRVPRALADLIERALSIDPHARYQSAAEIGAALEAIAHTIGRPEPIARKATRAAMVVAAAAAAVGVVGFITTLGFNLTFGREGAFASEPLTMNFVWGRRALLPSAVVMMGTAIIVLGVQFMVRVIALIEPIGRALASVNVRARRFARRAALDKPGGLAQASAALAIVTLGAMCWYHADLIAGWSAFINSAPAEKLMALRPENVERVWYRIQFDVITLAFGLLLYKVIRLQRKHKTHDGTAAIALLAAIIAVMLLMNEWPYRVLLHREFERVDAAGTRCYITGATADEFLLFCPGNDPPRNRTVKRTDPAIQRSGVYEDVFKGLNPSRSRS